MHGVVKRALRVVATVVAGVSVGLAAQGSTTPVPRPFPGSSPPPAGSARPAEPPRTQSPGDSAAPEPAAGAARQPGAPPSGLPVYPAAEFLDSFDAGSGQRYYLFGTASPFAEIVAYYRNVLRNGGREIYRTPATHQFDLGRFDDERMAYPPSVVVKDYTWNNSPGYLHVAGTTSKRYPTIIQIVPADPTR
jgi:hypothetical protein